MTRLARPVRTVAATGMRRRPSPDRVRLARLDAELRRLRTRVAELEAATIVAGILPEQKSQSPQRPRLHLIK